ncbi:MAG: serine/threonine-protein kinase [Planctomycetota bacterium]
MEHRVDAALCQHLLRQGLVPVSALVACAEAQREARRAGAAVPYLWELLTARRALEPEALLRARRATGDPAAPRSPAAPAASPAPVAARAADDTVALALLRQSGEYLPGWGPLEDEGVTPGDRLGDYEVERPLGHGSMGTVFVARDLRSGRRVALKVLAGLRARGAAGSRRFHVEARLLCSLRHEHLVRGLGFGSSRGRPFLAMELVEGPSLKHLVHQEGPLDPAEVARLGAGLARALAYLHAEGVVHRDVKPANVLVGPDGRARLCDLGLARDTDCPSEATASGDTLGTPCYMAPEQARGARGAGPSADLYSLGVTLFHAVAGRPPFQEQSGIVVLSRHLFDGIPDVRTLRPETPTKLAQTIWRLTRKEPRDRTSKATEVVRALEALAATPQPLARAA